MRSLFISLLSFISLSAFAEPVLVSTDWLAKNMNNKDIVIVDTSDYTQHQRFHIPGALQIDYSEITYRRKPDRVSMQAPNPYLMQLLARNGISNNSYIVLYDDMGGLNAGRLFWQLEQIGHEKVSVLNGGLVKWILEHREVTNKVRKPVATQYVANKQTKDNVITKAELANSKALLIDARTKDEFIGHPKAPRSGHISGAQLWSWQDNVDFENSFTLKDPAMLEQQKKHIGLKDKKQPIVTYCQSGHRASQSYLTLRSMGFENVKLYDGSMAEYSLDKNAPLEKGCTRC